MKYVNEFLRLRCSFDVLGACNPINKPAKEISESMALIRVIKSKILNNPDEITLYDLCAGNALTGILVAHLLPIKTVIAIDKNPVCREGHKKVQKFAYWKGDIFEPVIWKKISLERKSSILIASHPCKELAVQILTHTNSLGISVAILACCKRGNLPNWTIPVQEEMGKYKAWVIYLAQLCHGKVHFDPNCLSPCNGLIIKGF